MIQPISQLKRNYLINDMMTSLKCHQGYVSLDSVFCCINVDHDLFNLSPASPLTSWQCNTKLVE